MLEALANPHIAGSLEDPDLSRLLRQARGAQLLPRLACQLLDGPAASGFTDAVRAQLQAATAVADHFRRSVHWEVNRIAWALADVDTKVVLLKGAAYIMADLPNGPGRLVSDIDILVPKESLAAVEQSLLHKGWQSQKKHEYDDYYYRAWMHELPPLWHPVRNAAIDIHHTILPPTGRVHPDAQQLLDAAVPLSGSRFFVLAPADMVLHSAAHLFQDGNLTGALRDVVDLDCLLRHFAESDNDFWDRLVSRARQLQLPRSLFYAVQFAQQLLNTPVPAPVLREVYRDGPPWPFRQAMESLGRTSLLPSEGDSSSWRARIAASLLLARGHWLRMPPLLLARHLTHKTVRRWLPAQDSRATANP